MGTDFFDIDAAKPVPETSGIAAPAPAGADGHASLDDLTANLPDELLTIDPEADAFATPAPVPDGEHLATLKLGRDKVQSKKRDSGQPYAQVHVEARVDAPGKTWDKYPVFDNATSIVNAQGTSRITGILRALGIPTPAQITVKDLVGSFTKVLAGEPRTKIVTMWEAYCSLCEKRVLRGMQKFPPLKTGGFNHVLQCPKCKGEVNTQARITRYVGVKA